MKDRFEVARRSIVSFVSTEQGAIRLCVRGLYVALNVELKYRQAERRVVDFRDKLRREGVQPNKVQLDYITRTSFLVGENRRWVKDSRNNSEVDDAQYTDIERIQVVDDTLMALRCERKKAWGNLGRALSVAVKVTKTLFE